MSASVSDSGGVGPQGAGKPRSIPGRASSWSMLVVLAVAGGAAAAAGHGPAQQIPGASAAPAQIASLYTLASSGPDACVPATYPPRPVLPGSTSPSVAPPAVPTPGNADGSGSSGSASSSTGLDAPLKPWPISTLTGPVNGVVSTVSPDLSTSVVVAPVTGISPLTMPPTGSNGSSAGSASPGTFVPELIDTANGTVQATGPTLGSSQLVLAGGELWGAGTGSPLSLCEMDPMTLNVIRQVSLGTDISSLVSTGASAMSSTPPPSSAPTGTSSSSVASQPFGPTSPSVASAASTFASPSRIVMAATPDGGLWVADGGAAFRLEVSSGDLQGIAQLAGGGTVDDLSVDPTSSYLYATVTLPATSSASNSSPASASTAVTTPNSVSNLGKASSVPAPATPVIPAPTGAGAVQMFQFNAHNGESLGSVNMPGSVGTAQVTAVNGGAWLSYRIPPMGATVPFAAVPFLQGHVSDPGSITSGTTTYVWHASTSVLADTSVMWISTSDGELSCVDPQSGIIRASENFTAGNAPTPLAADSLGSSSGRLLVQGSAGQLEMITPPSACW